LAQSAEDERGVVGDQHLHRVVQPASPLSRPIPRRNRLALRKSGALSRRSSIGWWATLNKAARRGRHNLTRYVAGGRLALSQRLHLGWPRERDP
jgi:hypothetical protein